MTLESKVGKGSRPVSCTDRPTKDISLTVNPRSRGSTSLQNRVIETSLRRTKSYTEFILLPGPQNARDHPLRDFHHLPLRKDLKSTGDRTRSPVYDTLDVNRTDTTNTKTGKDRHTGVCSVGGRDPVKGVDLFPCHGWCNPTNTGTSRTVMGRVCSVVMSHQGREESGWTRVHLWLWPSLGRVPIPGRLSSS